MRACRPTAAGRRRSAAHAAQQMGTGGGHGVAHGAAEAPSECGLRDEGGVCTSGASPASAARSGLASDPHAQRRDGRRLRMSLDVWRRVDGGVREVPAEGSAKGVYPSDARAAAGRAAALLGASLERAGSGVVERFFARVSTGPIASTRGGLPHVSEDSCSMCVVRRDVAWSLSWSCVRRVRTAVLRWPRGSDQCVWCAQLYRVTLCGLCGGVLCPCAAVAALSLPRV